MLWSDEELDFLVKNYGKIKFEEITKQINRTAAGIRYKASYLGLKSDRSVTNKKYRFNDSFFDVLNPRNCYIAGLIASDGCINSKRKSVWFFQKDKTLVDYIKQSLDSNNKIYYRKREKTEEYSILFTSQKMVDDLYRHFGIVDNKSQIGLPIPNIEDIELFCCYIAGLIDGDGSISYRFVNPRAKSKTLSFTLLCSECVLNRFNYLLSLNLPIDKRTDCNAPLYKTRASGKNCINVLQYILDILIKNNIHISKKWEKVKCVI